MRRGLRILAVVAILFPSIITTARAESAPSLFITEVQTNSGNAGSQEFIELYNNTDNLINIADANWKIQYFSSTKVMQPDFNWNTTAPTGEISLTGTIQPHDYFVLATYQPNNVVPDQIYDNSHLSDTAGGVQLVTVNNSAVTTYDHVGWSNADAPPHDLYATPPAGGSLQRQTDEEGSYIDAAGNLGRFVPSNTATPKEAWQAPPPENDPVIPGLGQAEDEVPIIDQPDTLRLTELLPNPASPATDANDEYIEIYNESSVSIDLRGFTIQTGKTFAYSYTIPEGTLEPHAYQIFTSSDTPLSLANSGGQARLLNPTGQVVDETLVYGEAAEGQAWALFNNDWQWTTTPTPGYENILSVPATATKAAAKKPAAPKKKAVNSKASAKKSNGTINAQTGDNKPAETDQSPAIHPLVLAGVGGGALLYGAYEYRTDLANRYYQLKRYRETRRAARAALAGR